jgi:hypothetical protein
LMNMASSMGVAATTPASRERQVWERVWQRVSAPMLSTGQGSHRGAVHIKVTVWPN